MKIVLVDNTELVVVSINRNYRPNDTIQKNTLDIQLPNGSNIDSVKEKLTVENCKVITIRRDGFDDIVYTDYELIGISENISSSATSININFVKES